LPGLGKSESLRGLLLQAPAFCIRPMTELFATPPRARRALAAALASALALPGSAFAQDALCPAQADSWRCVWVNSSWQCAGSVRALPALAAAESADPDSLPINVQADSVRSDDGNLVRLQGNVSLQQGAQSLRAPQLDIDRAAEQARATGGVELSDPSVLMFVNALSVNLADQSSEVDNARYALRGSSGNGRARKASHKGNQTTLKGVTFTSCPGDAPAWQVKASRIALNHDTQVGQARDFKLLVGKLPVFYLPYASFPLTDARKSGFLAPVIGANDDGVDLTLPYYFNLAPNYDLTLNNRLVQERGAMLGSEFRYLGLRSTAKVRAAFMPNDRKSGEERYSANIDWQSALSAQWRFVGSLNEVSDDFYFEDLGDSLTVASTSVLPSNVGFYGRGALRAIPGVSRGIWQASISADRFVIVDPSNPNTPEPYRRAPRFAYQLDQHAGDLEFGISSELVSFRREPLMEMDPREGERVDLSPYLRYTWRTPYAYARPELKYRHTRYRLEDGLRQQRSQPIAAFDSGLTFERFGAFGRPQWRQTLEPRFFYLYSPFRAQDELPVFDTTELDFSFPQLFRSNRFSGADRQADANQATLALSTRILDDSNGRERLRLSLGQIRYFEDSLVTLPGINPIFGSEGVWVAEAASELNARWRVAASQQYDPETERTRLSAIRVQRVLGDQGLINLGYRYRPQQIEQFDLSSVVPLNANWSVLGRWNYSLPESRTLEGLAGFEYRSCCWRIRVLGRRYLRAGTLSGRNSFFFELELNGLGSLGRKTDRLLERAIFGFSDVSADR
jgi:LPS-assembly protein